MLQWFANASLQNWPWSKRSIIWPCFYPNLFDMMAWLGAKKTISAFTRVSETTFKINLIRKCTIAGHRSRSTKIAVPHRYLADSIFIHKARHHIYPIELIWVNDALPFCIWLNFPPRHFSKHPQTNIGTWPHFMFLMWESILRSCFQYLHCNGFECHVLNHD